MCYRRGPSVNSQRGTGLSYREPCQWVTMETGLLAPVKPSDDALVVTSTEDLRDFSGGPLVKILLPLQGAFDPWLRN